MMTKNIFLIFIILLCFIVDSFNQTGLIGWATVGNGVSGGAGGETVTVSNRNQFVAYAASDDPFVIRIQDTIELNLYERIKVGSNTTILGITVNAMLRFGGLEVEGSNVIIRNLIIRDSYDGDWDGKTNSTDAITVVGQNVWIDHCWLAASADGLCDIRSNNPSQIGDLVTVSYTRFSDHNKVSLIGSSDESTQDRDHLRTTFHHCWFDGTLEKGLNQRLPRVRYGDIHLFNNYFEDIASYCILARIESDVVVENNYFRNSNNPHGLDDIGIGMKDPELVASGNIYEFSGGNKNTSGDAFSPADHYLYELDETISIPAQVMNEAGPFNDPANHDPVANIDTITLDEVTRSFEMNLTANDTDEDGDNLRMGVILNEIDGAILTRNNVIRYIAPSNRTQPDTVLYEVIDTRGGYAKGQLIVFFAELITATKEALKLKTFSIFPNPAFHLMDIHFSIYQSTPKKLLLTDLSGRNVLQRKIIPQTNGNYHLKLPVEHLRSGTYILSISDDGLIYSQKILVL